MFCLRYVSHHKDGELLLFTCDFKQEEFWARVSPLPARKLVNAPSEDDELTAKE